MKRGEEGRNRAQGSDEARVRKGGRKRKDENDEAMIVVFIMVVG